MIHRFLIAVLRCGTALVLGGAVLWHVATHAGTRPGQAIVHVMEGNVDVRIDDYECRVDSRRDAPLSWELRPGRHTLRMCRSGELLSEEEFAIFPGEDTVLTAWNPHGPEPAGTPSE
jgi:hypothetical protein